MARKTVVRRLFKYLPVSVELATAMELQAGAEKGEFEGLTIDAEPLATETKGESPKAENENSQPRRSRADALKGDLKGSSTTDAPEAGDAPASEDVLWPEE